MERQLVVRALAIFLVVLSASISLSTAKTPTNGYVVMQNENAPPQRVLIADPSTGEFVFVQNKNDPLMQRKLDVDPHTDEFVMAQKNYEPPQGIKKLKKKGPALDQPTDELLMVQNKNDPHQRKLVEDPLTDESIMVQNKNDPPQRKLVVDPPTNESIMVQNKNDPPQRKLADDPIPANPYKRACTAAVKCRTRRLLSGTTTPKVIFGPQHHVNSGN